MFGHLDRVTPRHVHGWAATSDGSPVDIIVLVNDVPVSSIKTVTVRPDLVNYPRKDVGFDSELPRSLEIGDVVGAVFENNQHLSGSPYTVTTLEGSREEKALWLVLRDMKLLEIGPSFNPTAPRLAGWNCFSLDHATQEELRIKYQGQQEIDRIEPVDYLWRGGPMESAIPAAEHSTFDAIIASHVIEHIPDPIAFFTSTATLLKEDGLVSLVIPDKRWMFDFFKPLSSTSDFLSAHHLRRTRHSKQTAFNNLAYNVHENGEIAWSPRILSKFGFFGENVLNHASDFSDAFAEDESSPYVDFHASIFTPSSFGLIMLELGQLGVLPFRVERRFPPSGCEFYVTLRKGGTPLLDSKSLDEQRLRLMKDIVIELGEQARCLLDN